MFSLNNRANSSVVSSMSQRMRFTTGKTRLRCLVDDRL